MLKKIKSLLFKSIFKSEADKISRESEMRTLGKCSEQMNMLRKENTKLLLSLNESEETYLQVKEESERIKKGKKNWKRISKIQYGIRYRQYYWIMILRIWNQNIIITLKNQMANGGCIQGFARWEAVIYHQSDLTAK